MMTQGIVDITICILGHRTFSKLSLGTVPMSKVVYCNANNSQGEKMFCLSMRIAIIQHSNEVFGLALKVPREASMVWSTNRTCRNRNSRCRSWHDYMSV